MKLLLSQLRSITRKNLRQTWKVGTTIQLLTNNKIKLFGPIQINSLIQKVLMSGCGGSWHFTRKGQRWNYLLMERIWIKIMEGTMSGAALIQKFTKWPVGCNYWRTKGMCCLLIFIHRKNRPDVLVMISKERAWWDQYGITELPNLENKAL